MSKDRDISMAFREGLRNVVFEDMGILRAEASKSDLKGIHLVIQPDGMMDLDWYANGYVEAAEALTKEIHESRKHHTSDGLLFPVLFLHIHALEIRLKQYLLQLISHQKLGSCNCVKPPVARIDQILGGHLLRPLFDEISRLVSHDGLHSNRDFNSLDTLVSDVEKYGLSTMSLRYDQDKQGVTYPLFDKQRWVLPAESLFVFQSAAEFLARSTHSIDFYFCESLEFEAGVVSNFNAAKQILAALCENELAEYYKFITENPLKEGSYLASDLLKPEAEAHFKKHLEVSEASKGRLKSISPDDLALACMGIRFGKSNPDAVPKLDWVQKSWSREDQIRHLIEDFYHIENALKGIESHVEYLEENLKLKLKCV